MSVDKWLKFSGIPGPGIPVWGMECDEATPEPTQLESVKAQLSALSDKEQREIYEFLYKLGHRINR